MNVTALSIVDCSIRHRPMKTILTKIGRAIRRRLSLKALIGGRIGAVAWGLSSAGAVAVLIWGIKTVAIPMLMLKTASWGLWGAGVLRQFQLRKTALDQTDRETNGDRNT